MTNGVRGRLMLDAGLEREILLAYPSSVAFSAAELTTSNAHRLAVDIAIDLACRAWSAVSSVQGQAEISFGKILELHRSPVRMLPSDEDGFPLFETKHVAAVAKAIQIFPAFDPFEIYARIDWENAKVQERRLYETGSSPVSPPNTEQNPDAEGYVKTPADPTAYRLAYKIMQNHVPEEIVKMFPRKKIPLCLSYKQFSGILDKNPQIKRWKPNTQRMYVHLADWFQYVEDKTQELKAMRQDAKDRQRKFKNIRQHIGITDKDV